MPILGLHHVTATVDDAQADVGFAANVLGLRLVKKTVNFDNPFVYHFYYGNERGDPGTIWTTFPYKGHGMRRGQHGAGQITATSFSVPAGSLDFWRARLETHGITPQNGSSRFSESALSFPDPSGLIVELVATDRDTREAWIAPQLDENSAIQGLHSVTITSRAPADTFAFMQAILGFTIAGTDGRRTRLTVNGDLPGQTIDVVDVPSAINGTGGMGAVHHVAMAVATSEEQLLIRKKLLDAGAIVTQVLDRQYFQSIYFREPGGVLFEVATTDPGFMLDEPVDELGRLLKLPPWEEAHRRDIEAGLAPVVTP